MHSSFDFSISAEKAAGILTRMCLKSEVTENGEKIQVTVPPTRAGNYSLYPLVNLLKKSLQISVLMMWLHLEVVCFENQIFIEYAEFLQHVPKLWSITRIASLEMDEDV